MVITTLFALTRCFSEYLCIHSLGLHAFCFLVCFVFFSVTYHQIQCNKYRLSQAVYLSCTARKKQSNFLGLFQFLQKISWDTVTDPTRVSGTAWDGYWEKDHFQLRGAEYLYLFTSDCEGSCGKAGVPFALRSTCGLSYPTFRSVLNAHGMNGMFVEGGNKQAPERHAWNSR